MLEKKLVCTTSNLPQVSSGILTEIYVSHFTRNVRLLLHPLIEAVPRDGITACIFPTGLGAS